MGDNMKDFMMFFCFGCIFICLILANKISEDRHNELMNSINKVENQIDSIPNYCITLEKFNKKNGRFVTNE